ncbi:MAG: outer membrane protein assembly factor BamD [Porphyromonadaceae bacterium]|nr:outer membrane protein assembly factor BamD [Porphyromonadaceae bacterium]
MKRQLAYIFILLFVITSCSEYQNLLKSTDPELKYDKAVEYYSNKKYDKAITLFDDVARYYRNTDRAELIINYLAKAYLEKKDFYSASEYYKTYLRSYPQGRYIQEARFMIPFCYYKDSPDVRLDQTNTVMAISGFQDFINLYPNSERAKEAAKLLDELNDKMALKELINADLYYNLGIYMGNNYLSAVITAENALKKYPATKHREDLMILILKSKYQQALYSEESLKIDRYQATVDEYYTYMNEFPEGKYVKEASAIFRDSEKKLPKND